MPDLADKLGILMQFEERAVYGSDVILTVLGRPNRNMTLNNPEMVFPMPVDSLQCNYLNFNLVRHFFVFLTYL